MKPLDDKDLRLIRALKDNARASLVSLGRDIGLSRSATHDRITKLEEFGVITGYTIKIDRTALPLVRAFLTISFTPGLSDGPLVEAIHMKKGVEAAYCLAGDVDVLVYCECDTAEELAALRDDLASYEGITTISTRHILSSSGS